MAGGGVGEAMLVSAVVGGTTSAATGGDPLKGALLGAATAGVGAGIAGATTGATAGTTAGATGTTAAAAPTAAAGTTAAAAAPAAAPGLDAALASANTTASAALPSAGAPLTTAGVDGAGLTSAGASEGLNLAGGSTDAGLKYTGVPQGASIDPFSLNYADPLTGSTVGATPTSVAAAENPMFPSINKFYAANPIAAPAGVGALASALGDTKRDEEEEEEEYSGALKDFKYTRSGYTPYRAAASGGLMDTAVARRLMSGGQLGSYSDGGQALQGPGDGMSDSIPGVIGGAQPARLADGEFVVPADVVSGIGNGSTDAGSRQLYAMMDKIREARTGRAKQAPEINPRRMMPA